MLTSRYLDAFGVSLSRSRQAVLRASLATLSLLSSASWQHTISNPLHSPLVYLAPSGVQKERILPEHMFVLPFAQSSVPKPGSKRDFVRIPSRKVSGWADRGFADHQGLSESQCTPLFWNAFTQRDAVSCIHTHSQNAGECSCRTILMFQLTYSSQSCSPSSSARTPSRSESRTRR